MFKDIKVGDKVLKAVRGWSRHQPSHCIITVTKVTATQATAGTCRFRLSDGHIIGENYRCVERATPERIAQIEAQQALAERYTTAMIAINNMPTGEALRSLPVDKLEALAAAIRAAVEV